MDMTAPRIVQEPAEGSREVVERELDRQLKRRDSKKSPTATAEEVERILGDVNAHKVVEILALKPTVAELEQATLWKTGQDDVLASARLKLTGKAAQIYDILSADEEEDENL
jgi:hypothetical protein